MLLVCSHRRTLEAGTILWSLLGTQFPQGPSLTRWGSGMKPLELILRNKGAPPDMNAPALGAALTWVSGFLQQRRPK